jgi:hypothetical protein
MQLTNPHIKYERNEKNEAAKLKGNKNSSSYDASEILKFQTQQFTSECTEIITGNLS